MEEGPYNKIVHIEIKVLDLDRAKNFYSNLFGWKVHELQNDEFIFRVNKGIGGSFLKVDKLLGGNVIFYVCVEDIDKYLKKVKELGGKVIKDKESIGVGYKALFEDTEGNLVGLYMPILPI